MMPASRGISPTTAPRTASPAPRDDRKPLHPRRLVGQQELLLRLQCRDVERLFLEEGSNKVTHFVISQGVLFKDRKLVPAHWVKSVEEDGVHLVVSAQLLEHLPSYEE